MTAVLDILNALSSGTVGVLTVVIDHLGDFFDDVGEFVKSSSANETVPLTPLEPATPIVE